MEATSGFFQWWYEAWGIGGWVIFMLLDIAAIAWLIYDSQTRNIRAVGWLLGTILPALLLLPSAWLGLSPAAQVRMQDSLELFFYLGLVGGIVPIVVAVGYFVTYQNTRGCENGHIYDASLAECPICAQERARQAPVPPPPPPPVRIQEDAPPPPPPPPPAKPKASAWLVDEGANRTYQLNQGDTRVGRGRQANDLVFVDKAVSREHLLIREEHGHFTLYDRGSKTGTHVNGRRMDSPLLLAHDDVIEIGDTRLRFITSRQ
jgi:hypothetical protein